MRYLDKTSQNEEMSLILLSVSSSSFLSLLGFHQHFLSWVVNELSVFFLHNENVPKQKKKRENEGVFVQFTVE